MADHDFGSQGHGLTPARATGTPCALPTVEGDPHEPDGDLKAEFEKSVALLNTLRDEVRVKLHLAGMDAKDLWNKLQSNLDAVEHAAKEASDASRAAVASALKTLKEFRESLH